MKWLFLFFLSVGTIVPTGRDQTQKESRPVKKEVYGFHLQNLFDLHTAGTMNRGYKGVSGELYNLIKELEPQLLRYPGGASANKYRFDKESKTLFHDRKQWIISVDSFIAFNKKIPAKVNLVANIYTGTTEENMALIEYLLKKGISIMGVELGNELYLPVYKISIDVYIKRASELAAKIKQKYPFIRVIATAAPVGTIKKDHKKVMIPYPKYSLWNRALAKADFYDAISFHQYFGEEACIQNNLLPVREKISCASEDLSDYINYTFPALIKYYTTLFPGKKIWITEWNIFEPHLIGNTMLHSLFVGKFMLKINDINSQHDNIIEAAVFHNVTSYSENRRGYNLISVSSKINENRNYFTHTGYHAFCILKDIFKDSSFAVKNFKMTFTKEFPDDSLNFFQIYKVGAETKLIFMNNTSNTYQFKSLDVAGRSGYLDTRIIKKSYQAKSLCAGTFPLHPDIQEDIPEYMEKSYKLKEVTLDAYSINSISIF